MALTTDIVAYYKLDWNANDAAGSNDGTINWATYTASGKINWAYDFDGTNDYISATVESLTDDWTYSCWVYRDSASWDNYPTILSKYTTSTSNREFGILCYKLDSYLVNINIPYIENNIVTSTTEIGLDTWYHIVATKSWTTWSLYIDWDLEDSQTNSTTQESSTDFWVWCWVNNTWSQVNFFPWKIDEVWIRDRALTSTEISELYNSWDWLQYPFTAWWVAADVIFFGCNF